jgi:hypothetical protein
MAKKYSDGDLLKRCSALVSEDKASCMEDHQLSATHVPLQKSSRAEAPQRGSRLIARS